MLSVYFVTFLVFLLLFILSRHQRPDGTAAVHRLLQPFLKIILLLWDIGGWFGKRIDGHRSFRACRLKKDSAVSEDLKLLYPENRSGGTDRERFYYQQKCAVGIGVLFAGNLLAFAVSAAGYLKQDAEPANVLIRNGYGEGRREILMDVTIEEGGLNETFSVSVEAQAYTQEEAYAWIDQAMAVLPEAILLENEDLDHVRSDLSLITKLEGNPGQIKWESGDYRLIDAGGHITALELPEEGKLCLLTAYISCQEYAKEMQMYIRILPGELSELERLRQDLTEAVKEAQEESRTQESLILPEEIDGREVIWTEHKEDTSVTIVVLAMLLAVGIFIAMDRDLHKKAEARKETLVREYPEIVSKLVLFLGAGMTMRGAFHRLAAGRKVYLFSPADKQKNIDERPAYIEIARVCHEMDSGISESQAYLNLGKRCQDQHYIRLSMLLTQNLTKGTAGLSELLEKEAGEAFAERKRNARKYGEEAGTKLLLPMIILLLVVMVVIMVPAFLSFSV